MFLQKARAHFGEAGQVDERQVDNIWREYLECNRLATDALVGAGHAISFALHLIAHLRITSLRGVASFASNTSLKSVYTLFFVCKNFAHSSALMRPATEMRLVFEATSALMH